MMAEQSPQPVDSIIADTPPPPTALPTARLDDEHIPAIPSPLNPDAAAAASRTRTREQREKKATLKKRELADGEPQGPTAKKQKKASKDIGVLSPIRYRLPSPKVTDFDPPKEPTLTPITPALTNTDRQYYESSDHVYSRRGFRYTHAIYDPGFPALQHRQSEAPPFEARFYPEDTAQHVLVDVESKSVTTEKGFRGARGNVGAREGRWFWECKILSGVKADPASDGVLEGNGHVRVGWARREATLDGPVGFDAYSYALRDVAGEKVHMSRPKAFAECNFCEGDVIGLEITLPSLSLHRKVVEGVYNKAVDVADDLDPVASGEFQDIIRDRVPIRYKAQLYFELYEYSPTKELEELSNPSPVLSTAAPSASSDPPNPNHPQPPLRTLPFSSIKIYRNGQLVGTPFTDLLAFLPPASKPLTQPGVRDARDGLDDGMLGYFPVISVFRGGAAEANFGPDLWFPPSDLHADEDIEMTNGSDHTKNPNTRKQIAGQHSRLRPMSERFNEQIAEDVLCDLVDEVDFTFQDGDGIVDPTISVLGPVDADVDGALAKGGGIKEIVDE